MLRTLVEDIERAQRAEARSHVAQIAVAIPLFMSTLVCSVVLFGHSEGVPMLSTPGVVAIADTTPGRVPLDIHARFDASTDESTYILLAINSAATPESPRDLALIFCGQIADEVGVNDVNAEGELGKIPLLPLPGASNSDSVLGEYAACRYALLRVQSYQTLLHIASTQALAERAGDRILYALPSVTTVLPHAPIGELNTEPWPTGTTLSVNLDDAPADLTLNATVPSLPASGQLSWLFEKDRSGEMPPRDYRISGTLLEETDAASTRTFVAGVLAGVSGAAAIWALEAFIKLQPRKRRSRT